MRLLIIGGGPAGVETALTASAYSNDVTLITDGNVGAWKSAMPNKWLCSVNEIVNNG